MNTKPALINRRTAFTLVEVIVMIVIIALLALFYLPTLTYRARPRVIASRAMCMVRLKGIGSAYEAWAEDNGDLIPSKQTVAKGGWADFLTNAGQGAMCWTNYAILLDDFSISRNYLICPSDERQPALSETNQFSNTNVSYFVGVSANINQPKSILGGDRNLGPGGVPSTGYGYSPNSGEGNDVAIPINSSKSPVSWTLRTNLNGTNSTNSGGSILFGDLHVEWTSSDNSINEPGVLHIQQWLSNTPPTTNWPAGRFPATPSIRLVFP
jgi:type II secretory pathway pseudopilin PulG